MHVNAFTDDALGIDDATAIAARIRAGEISATEALEAAIARTEKVDPDLHALAWRAYDRARSMADGPLPSAAFTGVPTIVKDNVALAGTPLTAGSRAVAVHDSPDDGAFTRQFLAQGVVPLGKSAMPEFGFSASTEFLDRDPVVNPWETTMSAGASSGGSAALVASGALPLAHGNDGGGSIRIPAAACGLVGLKPSRGRTWLDSHSSGMPIRIITEGVLTRSVRDTATFLHAAERFYRSPRLRPVGRVEGPSDRRLRIGVVHDSPFAPATDDETRAAVRRTAQLLAAAGHDVSERDIPIPETFAADFEAYWKFLGWGMLKTGHQTMGDGFDPGAVEELTAGLARGFRTVAWKMPLVLSRLAASARAYDRAFGSFDLVLSPVVCRTTPTLGWLGADQPFERHFRRLLDYVGFTPLNNATGTPAISLPAGTTSTGLPIGVHFAARHGDERTLLEVAYELEAAAPWSSVADVA